MNALAGSEMQDSGGAGVGGTAVANPSPPETTAPPAPKAVTATEPGAPSTDKASDPAEHSHPPTETEPDAAEDADSFEVFSHAHRGNTVKTATGKVST